LAYAASRVDKRQGHTGPADGVRGQPRSFTVSATDLAPTALAAGFTYAINWGDGSPVDWKWPSMCNAVAFIGGDKNAFILDERHLRTGVRSVMDPSPKGTLSVTMLSFSKLGNHLLARRYRFRVPLGGGFSSGTLFELSSLNGPVSEDLHAG
jgi:hypothetical protein